MASLLDTPLELTDEEVTRLRGSFKQSLNLFDVELKRLQNAINRHAVKPYKLAADRQRLDSHVQTLRSEYRLHILDRGVSCPDMVDEMSSREESCEHIKNELDAMIANPPVPANTRARAYLAVKQALQITPLRDASTHLENSALEDATSPVLPQATGRKIVHSTPADNGTIVTQLTTSTVRRLNIETGDLVVAGLSQHSRCSGRSNNSAASKLRAENASKLGALAAEVTFSDAQRMAEDDLTRAKRNKEDLDRAQLALALKNTEKNLADLESSEDDESEPNSRASLLSHAPASLVHLVQQPSPVQPVQQPLPAQPVLQQGPALPAQMPAAPVQQPLPAQPVLQQGPALPAQMPAAPAQQPPTLPATPAQQPSALPAQIPTVPAQQPSTSLAQMPAVLTQPPTFPAFPKPAPAAHAKVKAYLKSLQQNPPTLPPVSKPASMPLPPAGPVPIPPVPAPVPAPMPPGVDSLPANILSYIQGLVAQSVPVSKPVSAEGDLLQVLIDQTYLNRIPVIEPSVFKGDPLGYQDWEKSFVALVEKRSVRNEDRLFYLKRYLAGSALECVEGHLLLDSADAYKDARKLLKERYGNDYILCEAYRDKLYNWKPIGGKDHDALRKYGDFLRQCRAAMKSINQLSILNDNRENRKMLEKLPLWLSQRWARVVSDIRESTTKYPSFSVFTDFVCKAAAVVSDPMTNHLREEPKAVKATPQVKQGRVLAATTEAKLKTAEVAEVKVAATQAKQSVPKGRSAKNDKSQQCPVCQGKHSIHACRTFLSLDRDARFQTIRSLKLCFKCQGGRHRSEHCDTDVLCTAAGCTSTYHTTAMHNFEPKPEGGWPRFAAVTPSQDVRVLKSTS